MSDLKELIQKLAGTWGNANVKTFDATVLSVDLPSRTCIVNSLDHSIDNILVRFMLEISDGDMNVPQVDSTVSVAMTDFTEPYIVSQTWLDQKIMIVGDTEIALINGKVFISQGLESSIAQLMISNGKINISNGTGSLSMLTIMQNILKHILALTVPTGTGNSGTPLNFSDFNNDLTDINNLLQ